ncbi:MAG: hypothetical protein ACFB00_04595 [Parvularculaceae bacterium]
MSSTDKKPTKLGFPLAMACLLAPAPIFFMSFLGVLPQSWGFRFVVIGVWLAIAAFFALRLGVELKRRTDEWERAQKTAAE